MEVGKRLAAHCQIVYADFNRKSYFPIGFYGESRLEPNRAERSNRTVQSVWADAIKSTDAVELSKLKRDIREEICIYSIYEIIQETRGKSTFRGEQTG